MCILFLYINPKPKVGEYKAVLVNNRDEMYHRPTKYAHFWNNNIVGGMDNEEQRAGGTWLAVSKEGKISCLLNVFQPRNAFGSNNASRGFLVVDYLKSSLKGPEYMEEIKNFEKAYNPFNLLTLDPDGYSYDGTFYNSEAKIIHKIQPGFHGFGNSPLEKPFIKVQTGKTAFQNVLKTYGKKGCEEMLIHELLAMMQNKNLNFPDPQIIQQGKGYSEDFLKRLSSIWVSCPDIKYGTRTTTVILVDEDNQVLYRERTMEEPVNPENPVWKNTELTFTTNGEGIN